MPRVPLTSRIRQRVLNSVAAADAVPPRLRRRLLRWCGVIVPCPGELRERFFFDGLDVAIGAGTYINTSCYFDCTARIEIGANCNIAPGVMFFTGTHLHGDENRRAGATISAPIVVGDGCWIGARVMILPGVTIAKGCVIGAGAVVTRDTLPDGLYVGIPAVRLRDLPTARERG
jgi:maltose O-acetyltransferase